MQRRIHSQHEDLKEPERNKQDDDFEYSIKDDEEFKNKSQFSVNESQLTDNLDFLEDESKGKKIRYRRNRNVESEEKEVEAIGKRKRHKYNYLSIILRIFIIAYKNIVK